MQGVLEEVYLLQDITEAARKAISNSVDRTAQTLIAWC